MPPPEHNIAAAKVTWTGAFLVFLSLVSAVSTAGARGAYPWIADWPGALPSHLSLEERFAAPRGFERVPAGARSFAAWLRRLPIRLDRRQVKAYDGRVLLRPSAAVVLMDVGSRDLQQCADTAIRLHAEWLWQRGEGRRASYHFTSGDRSAWSDWVRGERFRIRGRKVERLRGRPRSAGHRSYRRWLDLIFMYAGTRSLRLDSVPVSEGAGITGGDFFVQPGSPGHTVVVLDVAADASGRRAALLGQGFIPAEDLHVLRGGGPRVLESCVGGSAAGGGSASAGQGRCARSESVWFLLPDAGHPRIKTPSWAPFARSEVRRFRMP